MGNRVGKVCLCSAGAGDISRRHDYNASGNSIYYVRPPDPFSDDDVFHVTTFRTVSGASVSANSSTPPSTASSSVVLESLASFESSMSFTSTPLHQQYDLRGGGSSAGNCKPVWWSPVMLNESFPHSGYGFGNKQKKQSLKGILKRVVSGSIVKGVFSIKKKNENANANVNDRMSCNDARLGCSLSLRDGGDDVHNDDENDYDYVNLDVGDGRGCKVLNCKCNHNCGDLKNSQQCCRGRDNLDSVAINEVTDRNLMGSENLQWAQGRAGEDRVHIVISEEHEWVFVGIYDGFIGPDATDYLLDNLFYAVHDELKGLLCGHNSEESLQLGNGYVNGCCSSVLDIENYPLANEKKNLDSVSKRVRGKKNSRNGGEDMWWENEGYSKILGLDKGVQLQLSVTGAKGASAFSHSDVLLSLSEALRKTEDGFLKTVDEEISNDPVLAMMGSCVLVMLMKREDVYLMNVGDSRAVLATRRANSLQLTMEHSTLVEEEVHRIRKEHPDDPSAITKGRVKGYLNVTRAFGAGFLKEPKQNNAVLETFKVNYVGDSPYITCSPSLYHHRLSPSDRFLILSSDGLHQYLTNEEAVAKVESFISSSPERDPAQLLIEEALCRAAKRAGMDFQDLLDIPQGERRLYHDDISIVIISFKGTIWRSSV